MRAALSYIFIVFGLVVLWASTSRQAMQYISDARDGEKWWCTYPCKHGDLVSMSYLDFVQRFRFPPFPPLKRAKDNGKKNTVLTLNGDSFTYHVADSNFEGVCKMYFINRNPYGGYYHLDTAKRNILLIELAERFVRTYLEGLQIFDELKDTGAAKNVFLIRPAAGTTYATIIPGLSVNDLFNEHINQNLQCNLFNYNFMMPMFETKAALNYYLFNRASGDVVISDDRQRLFLKETVSTEGPASSYSPVSMDEVKKIVDVLNAINDHYRKIGFNDVYISIIPNSSTIMQPNGYNNLIPLIQDDSALKMKVIDIYSVFKRSHELYYMPGDTHWNNVGKQVWLDVVNDRFIEDENNASH